MNAEPRDDGSEPAYVYRVYDGGGRLLYVGFAVCPEDRFRGHEHSSRWYGKIAAVAIEKYPDVLTARAAETDAIKAEWPLWNISQSPDKEIVQQIASRALLAQQSATSTWLLRGAAKRSREARLRREFDRHLRQAHYVKRMVKDARFAADYPEFAALEARRWAQAGWRDFPGSPEEVHSAKMQAIIRLYEIEKAEEERASRDAAD